MKYGITDEVDSVIMYALGVKHAFERGRPEGLRYTTLK